MAIRNNHHKKFVNVSCNTSKVLCLLTFVDYLIAVNQPFGDGLIFFYACICHNDLIKGLLTKEFKPIECVIK